MSVLRDLTKPLREMIENRDRLLDKVKDLSALALRTAITVAGQALLLADQLRKRVMGADEDRPEREAPTAEESTTQEPEASRARRRPVIYAPRPGKAAADSSADASPVGEKPATEAAATKPTTESAPAEAAPGEGDADRPAAPVPAAPAAAATDADRETTAAEPAASPADAAGTETSAAPARESEKPEQAEAPQTAPAEPAEPVAAQTEPAEPPVSGPAEPIPGYDKLTLPSLRARLRGKSAEQVQALLDYERANANRPEVVRLFQNRLAKLRAEG